VDADDAVVDLADTAQVLALHAGVLVPDLTEEVSSISPDVAQVVLGHEGQARDDVLLQLVAELAVPPLVVLDKLLQGTDRAARGAGDGLDALALQFREQAPAVGVQVAKGLGVAAAVQIRSAGKSSGRIPIRPVLRRS